MQSNSNYWEFRFLKVENITPNTVLVAFIGECELVLFIVYNDLGKGGNSWSKAIGMYLGVWQ